MATHIVQSPEWGKFKIEYGTKTVRVGGIQYTIHKLPLLDAFYAYSPRVNPEKIDYEKVKESLVKNKCVAINFDVPNILTDDKNADKCIKILEDKCVKSPRDTFAKANILVDLTKTEEDLMNNMHKKHRYNVRYAERNGVKTKRGRTMEDLEEFYKLLADTAVRQRYYIHPKKYYEKLWKRLNPLNMAHILTTTFEDKLLASWMLLTYNNVIYYPYGGSSEEHKNLFGSNVVGWETIKLGKELDCNTFDMWGAADDPEDRSDSYHGFTNFKMKFGGRHVTYIDSYDFVVNKSLYTMFNLANSIRWTILKVLK